MVFLRPVALLILGSSAVNAAASRPNRYLEKQFSQTFYDNYNVLKHNGGNGPYSDRESYGIDRNPPAGCSVDQVIMLKRHGERYPDPSTEANMEASLAKVYAANATFKGDLAFLNDWTYFVPSPSYYAQETFSGPYTGLLSGYTLSNEYRARYGHLWDGESIVPVFSSGYERIIETARKFGEGFFGYNYSSIVALNIISENATQGADSLTPTCVKDNDTAVCGSLTGVMPQFDIAAKRFGEQNPGVNISASDVANLMRKNFSNDFKGASEDEG
jgi:acid phosphatase